MAKAPAMGKGLGALIQSKNINLDNITTNKRSQTYEVVDIEISKISANPRQPRTNFDKASLNELKDSILKHGLMNPVTVKATPTEEYELVAGERRLRAFQLAGISYIPAIITSIASNAEQLEKALIENIQREDLDPIDIANSYQQLIEEFEYTQEQLAERVGKARSSVTNILRILRLPDSVKDLIQQKLISLGHAKILLSLEDSSQIINIANDIVNKGLSVDATRNLIQDVISEKILISKDGKKKIVHPKQASITTEEQIIIKDIQNRLRSVYGTNIKIFTKSDNKGTIEFEFYSTDDFERIVELLENKNFE